jgi:hypothetical protein
MTEKEIVQALREECETCSERLVCKNGTNLGGFYCANKDAADLIERLSAENAALREKKLWQPVLAGNPERKGCYLVTVRHWLDGAPVAREAFWNGVDWLSCERRHEITPRVTHWSPLPEAPEEGDNDGKTDV